MRGETMTFEEIPLVVLDNSGRGILFIVAEVSDGTNTKMVIRGLRSGFISHVAVKTSLQDELSAIGAFKFKILGGGDILLDEEYPSCDKTMEIVRESGTFGREPDRGLTRQLIQEAFPNYKVSVKN
jgi:hypothetical protein